MGPAVKVLGGFFLGGFLGWMAGVSWFEFVEVPKAASMDLVEGPSYLCAAGRYLPLLAVPGAFLGLIVGIVGAIAGGEKNQGDVQREGRNQPQ
ncbi:MAG TPA: hypothetical protein VJ810_41870 [Blastocatellia bacterium]|nr:hypothetical protein [Blastocatellia bacterium]